MTKKAIAGGWILIALIVLALAGPSFVDWNRFRGQLEQQLTTAAGRDVTIGGGIGFSLLPRPALSLRKLQMANATGARSPVMLEMERLDVQLGVRALLTGTIQLASLRMTAPVLHLEIMADGKNNWGFANNAGDVLAASFDQMQITDGIVRYIDARSEATLQFDKIAAQVIAPLQSGPFNVTGSLHSNGVPVKFAAEIGASTLGTAPLSLSIEPISAKADAAMLLKFTGHLKPPGPHERLKGALVMRGDDLAHAISLGSAMFASVVPPPPGLAAPFEFESQLMLSDTAVQLQNARLEIAGNNLGAELNMQLSPVVTFDAGISAASFDVDTLLAGAAWGNVLQFEFAVPDTMRGALRVNIAALKLNAGQVREVRLAASLASGVITLDEFSAKLPGNSSVQLDGELISPAGKPRITGNASVQSENLRELLAWTGMDVARAPPDRLSRLQAKAQYAVTAAAIQVSAIEALIDSSTVRGSIAIGLGARPAYDMDVQIDQLNADAYQPLLPQSLSPDHIVSTLAAIDSKFALRLPSLMYRGAAISEINLDGQLSNGVLTVKTLTVSNAADTAFALSGVLAEIGDSPKGKIKLQAASKDVTGLLRAMDLPVPGGGNPGAMTLDANWRFIGELSKTEIDVRLGETAIKFSGEAANMVRALMTDASEIGALHAVVQLGNQSLTALAGQFNLPAIAPVDVAADAPVTFRGELTGDLASLEIIANADIAGASFELTGGVDNILAKPEYALTAALNSSELTPLLRGLGFDFRPANPSLGGVSLGAVLSGTGDNITLRDVQGDIGPVSIEGEGQYQSTGEKPSLELKITTGELLIDQFFAPPITQANISGTELPWSGAPLDLAVLDAFNADIELRTPHIVWRSVDLTQTTLAAGVQDGDAQLTQLSGKLYGGPLQLTANLKRGGAAPEFAAVFDVSDADIAPASMALFGDTLISGRFNLSGQLSGAGASTFALVSDLEGSGKFSMAAGAIHGIDLPSLSAQLKELREVADLLALLKNSFASGQTPVSKIEMPLTLSRGVVQGRNTVMDIEGVISNLSLNIDLPRYWLDAGSKFSLTDHGLAPDMGISFIGPVNNPGREVSTGEFQAYFTGHLVSKGLERLLEAGKAAPTPAVPVAQPPLTQPLPESPAEKTP